MKKFSSQKLSESINAMYLFVAKEQTFILFLKTPNISLFL
jgi:hypothetical protein